jgi:hypothetical protein
MCGGCADQVKHKSEEKKLYHFRGDWKYFNLFDTTWSQFLSGATLFDWSIHAYL